MDRYKANCTIGCPPDTLCSSFGGLCAEPNQEGQALPSFLNAKCERGQVCKKHVGTQRCLENASAARCGAMHIFHYDTNLPSF